MINLMSIARLHKNMIIELEGLRQVIGLPMPQTQRVVALIKDIVSIKCSPKNLVMDDWENHKCGW